jgi:hypothetical protein
MPHPTMCCTAPSLALAQGLGVIYNARVIVLAHAIMTLLTWISSSWESPALSWSS